MSQKFQDTKNIVLQTFLDNTFLSDFKDNSLNKLELELILTPYCNEHCSYCYINKYGNKLFEGCDISKENILKNLEVIVSCLSKNYSIRTLDIFSGEFFNLPYWKDVFEIIIRYSFKKNFCKNIMIPTNGTFITNPNIKSDVELYIEKLKKVGIDLRLSLSIDGKYIDKHSRTLEVKDIFYNEIFDFAFKYEYGFHPMVSKEFVENFEENYTWWIKNLSTRLKEFNNINSGVMFLEVRNDYWDDELIEKYHQGLLKAAEIDFKYLHNSSTLDFADRFFTITNRWNRWNFNFISFPHEGNKYTCSIQKTIQLRVPDSSIVMCHRLSYKGMVAATLDFTDNGIKVKEAKNLDLFFKIKTTNPNISVPKCFNCPINQFCMKGCLGSQFETSGELFHPIESVCKLMITRYKSMNEIAEKFQLYDALQYFNLSPARMQRIEEGRNILCKL